MNRRQVLIGGALAAGGALGLGLQPRAVTPVWARTPLEDLVPQDLPGWRAVPGLADAAVPADDSGNVARTYGAVLTRIYRDAGGAQVLALVACAAAVTGDRQIHRPEACYPAAGFSILGIRDVTVPLGAGRNVPGRFLTARAGDRIEHVLYWIRVGDRFPRHALGEEAASLRSAIGGRAADGVLARFSTVGTDATAACALLGRFAAALVGASGPDGRALLANM